MKIQKYIPAGLFLFMSLISLAQTTNIGELTVLNNTQLGIVDDFNNTATATVMNDGEMFVYSNFNNDGLFSYFDSNSDGFIRFEGIGVQQISGNALSEFYNVLFNNASSEYPFQLRGDLSIVNRAEFYQGIVKNDDFGGNITFEALADHISTSNISYVDGLVYKNGDTAFEFPIGDAGYYRKAAISLPENENEVFSSKYFLENSNVLYPHNLAAGVIELIDDAEYWTIIREQGTSDVMITLSWSEETTPTNITTSPTSAIHVVRWDDNLGFWVDEGGIVDDVNQTVTTFANVSGYGVFTLARVKEDLVLPGDIVIYNALSPNNDNKNSFFFIDGIDKYPNNSVEIFNRWGVKVYETNGYNESTNVFNGVSQGRMTVKKGEELPTGTYFYILNYEYNDGSASSTVKKAGYLYINRDD